MVIALYLPLFDIIKLVNWHAGGPVPIRFEADTRMSRLAIAVGTALAGDPPHRSERAGLPHSAAHLGVGVQDFGRREPPFL